MVRASWRKRIELGLLLTLLSSISHLSAQMTGREPSRLETLRQQQMITGSVGLTFVDGTRFYLFA